MFNKIYFKIIAVIFFTSTLQSCSDDFIKEEPKDFFISDKAFSDPIGFEYGITNLHKNVRDIWTAHDGLNQFVLFGLGSDLAGYGPNFINGFRMDYSVLGSDDAISLLYWTNMYIIVKNANVIINRADNPDVQWEYDSQKSEIVAEATFFRAYAYRILVQLFGGVPIIDYEVEQNVNNLTRSSKSETYNFIINDLLAAIPNLRAEESKPGRITKAAAYHLLAEAYVATEQWQKGIDAATAVIDDPNYELMTSRFGTRVNEPGDVYWDLFRIGNQNRSSGNTETIWAIQIEANTPGGGIETGAKGLDLERGFGPFYSSLKDPDGASAFVLSDQYGRPVGWCTLTDYMAYDIWDMDEDNNYDPDMRNSSYNIHRFDRGDFVYNNPNSSYFGTPVLQETVETQPLSYWFPYFMKNTTPNNHPGGIINTGRIWRDHYVMRLAETYLLRAEAYLGAGNKVLAVDDINTVRDRAEATPITDADVDINFILDERARELSMEEFRTLTLMRLGLMYDRTRDFNPWAGTTIQPKNNLWPIPQSQIDLNTGEILEQNPGY